MNFKVVAGDFPQDTEFVFSEFFAPKPQPKLRWGKELDGFTETYKGEYQLTGKVARVEIVTEENKKKLLGSAGWGTAGAVIGGLIAWPVGVAGLIAGVLKGGNKKEICFACYLKDDKKFMAVSDAKTYQQITSLTF
jgi:hypothetical protein